MHERNRAVGRCNAKTYERYIEEFAADSAYPFEDHEDAPGIPDLQAGLTSHKMVEAQNAEPQLFQKLISDWAKFPRAPCACMAENKFYDANQGNLTC